MTPNPVAVLQAYVRGEIEPHDERMKPLARDGLGWVHDDGLLSSLGSCVNEYGWEGIKIYQERRTEAQRRREMHEAVAPMTEMPEMHENVWKTAFLSVIDRHVFGDEDFGNLEYLFDTLTLDLGEEKVEVLRKYYREHGLEGY